MQSHDKRTEGKNRGATSRLILKLSSYRIRIDCVKAEVERHMYKTWFCGILCIVGFRRVQQIQVQDGESRCARCHENYGRQVRNCSRCSTVDRE